MSIARAAFVPPFIFNGHELKSEGVLSGREFSMLEKGEKNIPDVVSFAFEADEWNHRYPRPRWKAFSERLRRIHEKDERKIFALFQENAEKINEKNPVKVATAAKQTFFDLQGN